MDGAILSKMENSIATWTINIPNIEKYVMDVSGDLAKYGAVKDIKEGVWRLPVQIRCKDRAGNERISDTYEIRLNIQK